MQKETFEITDDMMATLMQRFCNYLVDFVVQYLLLMIVFSVVAFLAVMFGNTAVFDWMADISLFEQYAIGIVTACLYYGFTETYLSRTIGKYVTGTVVVHADGSKPDSGTIAIRTLCRFIPFEPFSFFWGRGWHDGLSRTYVVKAAALEAHKNIINSIKDIGAHDL